MNNPENGLYVYKNLGSVSYSVQYESAEYIIDNMEKDPFLKSSALQKELPNYHGMEYYIIQLRNIKSNTDILTLDLENKNEYYERENYYSFDFQNDICLIRGGDTIPCTVFNYVPNYGISPHIDFMVAFVDKEKTAAQVKADRTIIIEDKIFNNGTIKLEIKKDNINKIPLLITY